MPRKKQDEPYQRPPADSPTYPVSTIAKLLLLTDRRVQQLSKEGVIPKTEHGRYELAPAVQGYVRYLQERSIGRPNAPEDYHSEKARLVKAQADRAELEVMEISGNLVNADDVQKELYSKITDCKTRLLGIPSKAAPIVAAEVSAGACQKIISDLVYEALEELSGNSGREEDRIELDEGMDATTEING